MGSLGLTIQDSQMILILGWLHLPYQQGLGAPENVQLQSEWEAQYKCEGLDSGRCLVFSHKSPRRVTGPPLNCFRPGLWLLWVFPFARKLPKPRSAFALSPWPPEPWRPQQRHSSFPGDVSYSRSLSQPLPHPHRPSKTSEFPQHLPTPLHEGIDAFGGIGIGIR